MRGYDALYVALAEALGATLLTLDERLANAPTIECNVEGRLRGSEELESLVARTSSRGSPIAPRR